MTATGCIKAIRICFLTAARAGLSPLEAARHIELDPALLADPNARVHHRVIQRAWEELPKLTGDSCFGLHAAEMLASAPFDIVDYVSAQAPTMRGAIATLGRYQRLLHEDAEFQVHTEHGETRMQQRLRSVPRTPRHFAEFVGWCGAAFRRRAARRCAAVTARTARARASVARPSLARAACCTS